MWLFHTTTSFFTDFYRFRWCVRQHPKSFWSSFVESTPASAHPSTEFDSLGHQSHATALGRGQ